MNTVTDQSKIIKHASREVPKGDNPPSRSYTIHELIGLLPIIRMVGAKYKIRYPQVIVLLLLYDLHKRTGEGLTCYRLLKMYTDLETAGLQTSMQIRMKVLRDMGLIEIIGKESIRYANLYVPSPRLIVYLNRIRLTV